MTVLFCVRFLIFIVGHYYAICWYVRVWIIGCCFPMFTALDADYNARITTLMRTLSNDPAMTPHSIPVPPPRGSVVPRGDFQTAASVLHSPSSRGTLDPRNNINTGGYSNGLSSMIPSVQRPSVIHPYSGPSDPAARQAVWHLLIHWYSGSLLSLDWLIDCLIY